MASCWFSSVLTLATPILSPCFSPRLSTTGETSRQGPHHGAQKSTRTGLSALRTSDSKVDSSTEIGAVVAMAERTCLPSVKRDDGHRSTGPMGEPVSVAPQGNGVGVGVGGGGRVGTGVGVGVGTGV